MMIVSAVSGSYRVVLISEVRLDDPIFVQGGFSKPDFERPPCAIVLDLPAMPSLQIQTCEAAAKQDHAHRLRNRGGFVLEDDAVIPEVTVRVKTESDVVPCTDVGRECS